jgi:hypothetical protein
VARTLTRVRRRVVQVLPRRSTRITFRSDRRPSDCRRTRRPSASSHESKVRKPEVARLGCVAIGSTLSSDTFPMH